MFVTRTCNRVKIGDIIGDSSDTQLRLVVNMNDLHDSRRGWLGEMEIIYFLFPASWKDNPPSVPTRQELEKKVLFKSVCYEHDFITIYVADILM